MGKIPSAIIGARTGGGREISIGVKPTGGELASKIRVVYKLQSRKLVPKGQWHDTIRRHQRTNRLRAAHRERSRMSGVPRGSFLFVALPPEGQEKSVVYQQLKSKVANGGNSYGDISIFPVPQFKVEHGEV